MSSGVLICLEVLPQIIVREFFENVVIKPNLSPTTTGHKKVSNIKIKNLLIALLDFRTKKLRLPLGVS